MLDLVDGVLGQSPDHFNCSRYVINGRREMKRQSSSSISEYSESDMIMVKSYCLNRGILYDWKLTRRMRLCSYQIVCDIPGCCFAMDSCLSPRGNGDGPSGFPPDIHCSSSTGFENRSAAPL